MIIKAGENLQILSPRNIEDFGFVKDFRNPESRISLDFESMVLVNEDYSLVYDWIYSQYGRFINIPAEVHDNLGNVYPYYLDLSEVKFRTDELEVGIQARKGTDHFFERANATTFELICQEGGLTESDFIEVPYLIVPNDLQLQRIVTIALTISTLQQLYSAIYEIASLGADALDVVGTGPLTTVAKAIALAVYLAILVIQFIIVFNQLKELYFPKIRYFKACSDYTLIKKGVEHLGFTLDSTALYNLRKAHTLPTPQAQEGQSIFQKLFDEFTGYFNTGYPTAQDTTSTLWSLIDYYLKGYNLKMLVYNGVVKIEKRSWFVQNASVVIKKTYANQQTRQHEWTYNSEEVYSRKYLRWTVDFTDAHSPDFFTGRQAEYITENINNPYPDLVNIKRLEEYQMPFAWGGRKNQLNRIEQFVSTLFGIADTLLNLIGGNGNLQAGVLNRVGVLMIEQQYFSVTKKLWLDSNGKQPANYYEMLSIDNIYNDYHTDLEVQNNCVKYETFEIPFTSEKFNELLQNNFIILDSGEIVECVNVEWKDLRYKAKVTLAIPDTSAFNIETNKLT